MQLLRQFGTAYPPSKITSDSKSKSRPDALRTRLAGPQPLARLTADSWIADDAVPPHLLFSDVESLHHRLLVANRLKDVSYVKWLTTSYRCALRARRIQSLPKVDAHRSSDGSSPHTNMRTHM